MDPLASTILSANHHAILFDGHPSSVSELAASLTKAVLEAGEVAHFSFDMLGVSESRALAEFAMRGPSKGDTLWIVFGFERATGEAQNALLKIIEDPPATARFVCITPAASQLLPTVTSRFLKLASQFKASAEVDVASFLRASPGARLLILKTYIEDKNVGALRDISYAIVAAYGTMQSKEAIRARTIALRVATEASGRSPSAKLLGEYLASSIPSFKGQFKIV